jgi:hypothetical protein
VVWDQLLQLAFPAGKCATYVPFNIQAKSVAIAPNRIGFEGKRRVESARSRFEPVLLWRF